MATPPPNSTPSNDSAARKNRAGAIFKFSGILVVTFFGVVYYLNVSDNQTYLIERNFRLLTVWSQQITGRLDSYQTAVNFAAQTIPTSDKRQKSSQPYRLKTSFSEFFVQNDTPEPRRKDKPETLHRDEARKRVTQDLQSLTFLDNVHVETFIPPPPSGQIRSRGLLPLHTIQRAQTGKHKWHLQYTAPERKTRITAEIPIDALLSEIADQTGKVFDDVLLADPQGRIVYQRNASEFQFTDLKTLFATQLQTSWLSSLFSMVSDATTETSDSSAPSSSRSTKEIISPAHVQIGPGGKSYELFIQSVMIPRLVHGDSTAEEEARTWYLCGLLSTTSFRNEYLAIPFTYLLLFVFILITVFLGVPFLSLALMNSRERLTRFSVFSLLLTTFLLAIALTFFILDVSLVRSIKQRITEQLQVTAQAIHQAFQMELDRILWQLNDYDKKITDLEDIEDVEGPKKRTVAWVARTDIPDPCQAGPGNGSALCFPYYSIMFWADDKGDLRVNWTPQEDPYILGVHPLRHRQYISVVQERTQPLMQRQIGDVTVPFYIQPLITLESSERTMVVSKPHEPVKPGTTPWVAAIQPEIISLLKTPALPSGTGYAVIHNDDGEVLFHSEAKRSFRENFFEETDGNEALQALVYSRTADAFEGEYWGKGHQFYVMPVESLPWSLVVYQDKQLLRALNFQILLLAGFLFFFYFLLLALFFGMIIWLAGRQARIRWRWWIWPNSKFRNRYRGIVLWNFAVGIGFCASVMWFEIPSGYKFLLSVAVPFLSLILLMTGLWIFRPKVAQDNDEPYPNVAVATLPYGTEGRLISLYSWMLLSHLLVFSIVPAGVIYSIAHREETELLIKHNLFTLGQSLLKTQHAPMLEQGILRDNGVFQYFPKQAASDAKSPKPLIHDCASHAREQQHAGMLTGFTQPTGFPLPSFDRQRSSAKINFLLNGILKDFLVPTDLCFGQWGLSTDDNLYPEPVFVQEIHKLVRSTSLQSQPVLQTWGFIQDGTREHTVRWKIDTAKKSRHVALLLENFPRQRPESSEFTSTDTLILSASVPFSLWMLPIDSPGWWIGIGSALLLVYLIIRFAIQRVFPLLTHMPKWGLSDVHKPQHHVSTPRNFLIVSPPGTGKSEFAHSQLQHWEVIDLRLTGERQHWSDAILRDLQKVKTAKPTIALDHFEHQLGHPEHDYEKRKLVEGLLLTGHHVAIFSSTNLIQHTFSLTHQSRPTGPQSESEHSTIDWGFIFQSFLLLYFSEPGAPQLIQESIIQKTDPSTLSQLSDHNPIVQAFQTECGPTAYLRSLGQWIRKRTEWITWSPDQLVANVLRLAKPYYYTLWRSCSLEEKMALYHIAKDGFVHAAQPELPILHQKGLIRFTPQVRVMNESFSRYILLASYHDDLLTIERAQTPNTWSRLKWPLLLGVGLIVLFMFATQQEFKNSLLALLSLLPVLLPAFPELPGFFTASKLNETSDI